MQTIKTTAFPSAAMKMAGHARTKIGRGAGQKETTT